MRKPAVRSLMRRDDHDNEAVVVVPELEGMSVTVRKR
jgi:hypothetical protein